MPTLCIFAQLLDKFRHSCYDEKNHRAEGRKYMIWGIVTAGAALLLILVALLHAQRRRNRLEKEMVERARTTDLYRALYPVLRTANRCCVDRVLIRRDEVRIVLFKPMNSVYRFVFEERGFDRVNDPKVLKALALAISADMDHLRDNRCYSFSVRQDITAQGGQGVLVRIQHSAVLQGHTDEGMVSSAGSGGRDYSLMKQDFPGKRRI